MTLPRDRGIIPLVRTTMTIDDDVLQAVKKIAVERKATVGQVLSDLARYAIAAGEGEVRNGVPLMPRLPKGSPPLTMEMVNRLHDEP